MEARRRRIPVVGANNAETTAEVLFERDALAITREYLGHEGSSAVFGNSFVITHVPTGRTVMARTGTFKSMKFATDALGQLLLLTDWLALRSPPSKLLADQVESLLVQATRAELLWLAKGGGRDG